MTTVVATKQAIFADTLCAYTVPFRFSKVAKIKDAIFAGAGDDFLNIHLFYEWQRGKQKPKYAADADFDIIEVNPRGLFLWDQKLIPIQLNEPFYAIGTGAAYAMGALAAGATPEQAVLIAANFDTNTRGPVEQVNLGGPERRKRAAR